MKPIGTIFLILLISFLTFCGCKSIQPTDFEIKDTTKLKLPNLVPEVNMSNLKAMISDGTYKETGVIEYTTVVNSLIVLDYNTKAEYIPEKRTFDILKIYGSDIKNNIVDSASILKGSIKMELLYFQVRKNFPLTFYSAWTLCITSLIGIPVTAIKTNLETKVSICDNTEKVVKSFIGKGKGVSFVAIYWGYGKDARRKSAIIAFKNAMQQIKEQMKSCKDEIIIKLN